VTDRGVDAPEIDQPYGQQARVVLFDLVKGHSLQLFVYDKDPYGRIVADIYCNNKFIQEVLLKRGCVWHFVKYDTRPEFAKWEKEAQAARVGLWVDLNPEKPWDYRKKQRSKSAPRLRSRH
jgi:endonuclease YncB( thermonuclease family)